MPFMTIRPIAEKRNRFAAQKMLDTDHSPNGLVLNAAGDVREA